MRRLRVGQIAVQVVLVWDDGDELTPGPQVEPQTVTLAGLRRLCDTLPEQVAKIEAAAPDDPES